MNSFLQGPEISVGVLDSRGDSDKLTALHELRKKQQASRSSEGPA